MLSWALFLYVTFCSGDILPHKMWGNMVKDNNTNLTEVLALPYLKLNSRNSVKGSGLWWVSLTKLDKGVHMLWNSTSHALKLVALNPGPADITMTQVTDCAELHAAVRWDGVTLLPASSSSPGLAQRPFWRWMQTFFFFWHPGPVNQMLCLF